ncbi:MAG TPA: PH domain-containing protein [Mycobacteriales bacterium]|nr:PH domain-containing protein [Mycobacteriales bacterium]
MPDRVSIGPNRWLGIGYGALAASMLVRAPEDPWRWVVLALLVPFLWSLWRMRTVLDREGVTVRRFWGERRVAWADVAALARRRAAVVAVTRDGERVTLPWVEWRPPARGGTESPRAAARVLAYARDHGYEPAAEGL